MRLVLVSILVAVLLAVPLTAQAATAYKVRGTLETSLNSSSPSATLVYVNRGPRIAQFNIRVDLRGTGTLTGASTGRHTWHPGSGSTVLNLGPLARKGVIALQLVFNLNHAGRLKLRITSSPRVAGANFSRG